MRENARQTQSAAVAHVEREAAGRAMKRWVQPLMMWRLGRALLM
jgi:hypothetical protein